MTHTTKFAVAAALLASAAALPAFAQDSDYCREYQQTLTIAGKTQRGYGTACLQPDGSWELQRSEETTTVTTRDAPPPPPNIDYVVEEDHVYVTPPEPFVVGTVFIGGHRHHFDNGFRPYHHWR